MSLETGRQNLNRPSVHHIQAGQSDVLLLDRTWEFEASYWGDTNPLIITLWLPATCCGGWQDGWAIFWGWNLSCRTRLVLRVLTKQSYSSVESRETQVHCGAVSENRSTRCSRMHFLKGGQFLRLRTVTSVQETRHSVSPNIPAVIEQQQGTCRTA